MEQARDAFLQSRSVLHCVNSDTGRPINVPSIPILRFYLFLLTNQPLDL